ncbi:hypothetical protein QBL07_022400 [Gordonia rubripertincta]|uniref:hypothetical protein n=1 Tax=Gordonia rubripertincta TaxID=36822 RepID=UPI0039B5147E
MSIGGVVEVPVPDQDVRRLDRGDLRAGRRDLVAIGVGHPRVGEEHLARHGDSETRDAEPGEDDAVVPDRAGGLVDIVGAEHGGSGGGQCGVGVGGADARQRGGDDGQEQ